MGSLGTKYRLGPQIGGGGMAEVYRGTVEGAEGFSRTVAIKRIHASFSRDPRFAAMFVNEARIASLLHHANICSVLDFDRDDEQRFYLVMELVEGLDLHALMQAGPVPIEIALHVAAGVLAGLDHAHEMVHEGKKLQIVHRDVSPHNVMLSWAGGVKLVDFGIAKAVAATNASQSGALKGKVGYMSPEQAQGAPLDGRSDVFAVGVVLHELLSRRRLFSAPSEPEVLSRVVSQPIARPREISPAVPQDVDTVVMAMLERDLSRRLPGARAALEALLSCRAITARGGLALRDLLAQRFPDRAGPGAQADISPALAETLPAALPTTLPERRPPPKPAAAVKTWTARARNPALEPTRPSAEAGAKPRRTGLILGVAALASVGLITATFFLLQREPTRSRSPSSDVAAEASPRPAPAPAPDPLPDAAMAAAVAEPDPEPTPLAPSPPPSPSPERAAKSSERSGDESADAGRLKIVVKPWADIEVDGVARGTSPREVRLSPGKHEIVLSNPSLGKYEDVSVTIQPRAIEHLVRDWRQ